MTVTHTCGGSEGCMCMYDPDLNDELVASRYVPTDDDAVERANEALCRFLFPGYVVPRSEMVRAVIDALAGDGDWRAKLPARRAAIGAGPSPSPGLTKETE
jgi:hypothetical protein